VKDERLEFPNRAVVEMKLGPPQAFGTANVPSSRMLLQSRPGPIYWDANTGRYFGQSNPPLEPLDVTVVQEGPTATRFELKGDRLRYEFPCDNGQALEGTIHALFYIFMPILSVEFPDAPFVVHTHGWIGETEFDWEQRELDALFYITKKEKLEQHIADSFGWLSLFHDTSNRRLAAALHYFHVAARLLVVGQSQWEFMAECVLNLTKVLQILFGEKMDDVRHHLAQLGYSQDSIEGDFVPIMVLRSKFDVAHARLALLKGEQLRVIYRYLAQAERRLRDLLKQIIASAVGGSYQVKPSEDLLPDAVEQMEIDRLVTSMEARLQPLPSEGSPRSG
jgi:hypothetical protein